MFLQIGNRIVEVRRTYIIIAAVIVLIALLLLMFVVFRKALFSNPAILWIALGILFVAAGVAAAKLGILSFRLGFDTEYRMMEFFARLRQNIGKIAGIFIAVALVSGSVFYFAAVGFPSVDIPKISLPKLSLPNLFMPKADTGSAFQGKSPQDEIPKYVPNSSSAQKTTVTEKKTTTTEKTTTTSTTTTTRKKKTAADRGFYTYTPRVKEGEQVEDCSFSGKGHDAVLMPSGNYYCRSTEQRISVKINGVDRICCVTP